MSAESSSFGEGEANDHESPELTPPTPRTAQLTNTVTTVNLVVQGKTFTVERRLLALASNFFRALFSHEFHDSKAPTLHLDEKGEMGLTVTAIEVLLEYAKCGQLSLDKSSAIQVFIAADALDVEGARLHTEQFLGTKMLSRHRPDTFTGFWKMSRLRHMKVLQALLDTFCLENFGWFCCSLPAFSMHYIIGWETATLAKYLLDLKFANCSEEQVFRAVVSYCQAKGGQEGWEELVPGLSKSCSSYLRYIQSVPRTLPCKSTKR